MTSNYPGLVMPSQDKLGPDQLRKVIHAYRDALRAHQQVINRLNVYPVPDGDTGTNMALTVESVCEELASGDGDSGMTQTCKAISHGSLMGARGNSGVILSQVLRGMSDVLRDHDAVDGAAFATALSAASDAAYGAVMKPVEGTILTVVREAAEAAAAVAKDDGGSLVAVVEAARTQGADALSRTPEMLPVLKQAGVVDAGGAGFLLLLDAVLHELDGRPLPEAEPVPEGAGVDAGTAVGDRAADLEHSDLRYEVMYFLEADDDDDSRVQERVGRHRRLDRGRRR